MAEGRENPYKHSDDGIDGMEKARRRRNLIHIVGASSPVVALLGFLGYQALFGEAPEKTAVVGPQVSENTPTPTVTEKEKQCLYNGIVIPCPKKPKMKKEEPAADQVNLPQKPACEIFKYFPPGPDKETEGMFVKSFVGVKPQEDIGKACQTPEGPGIIKRQDPELGAIKESEFDPNVADIIKSILDLTNSDPDSLHDASEVLDALFLCTKNAPDASFESASKKAYEVAERDEYYREYYKKIAQTIHTLSFVRNIRIVPEDGQQEQKK